MIVLKDGASSRFTHSLRTGESIYPYDGTACDTQSRMDTGDDGDASLELLLRLTADDNVDVRFALAENHNIHQSVLNVLVHDTNPYVAHRAQKTLARLEGGADNIISPANGFRALLKRAGMVF